MIPLAIVATVITLGFVYDLSVMLEIVHQYLESTPWYLFTALVLVLPLTGIPLSYILIPVGIRFGPVPGIILLITMLPLQLLLMYYLGRYPFRIYMAISLPVTFILTAPFVLLGGSARQFDPMLFAVSVACILAAFFLVRAISLLMSRSRSTERI